MAHIYAGATDEYLAARLLDLEERLDRIGEEWPSADGRARGGLADEATLLRWQRDRVRAEIRRRGETDREEQGR